MIATRLAMPLSLLLVAGGAALAATEAPSGTVVAVIQQADANGGPPGKRVLSPQSSVYMGDVIKTGEIGEAQLKFRDQTKLVVGPNSQLVVDSFVFTNQNTAQSVSINAVRGTFRFITGSSPKSAYSLKTPVATIGVRGTRFDFNVEKNGKTTLVLYEGAATLCNNGGSCVEMRGGCGIAVVPPNGPARRVATLRERESALNTNFPYLAQQAGLQRAFRIDVSNCSVQKAYVPEGNGGGSNQFVPTRQQETPPPPPTPPTPPPPTPPTPPTPPPPTPPEPPTPPTPPEPPTPPDCGPGDNHGGDHGHKHGDGRGGWHDNNNDNHSGPRHDGPPNGNWGGGGNPGNLRHEGFNGRVQNQGGENPN